MGKKTWLILLAIAIFGFAVRAFKIQSLPLYGDELTMVYDTYSISKTGMDATGAKLPLTFRMGAGRPGGYIYFSVPFVMLFGPTVWGERMLSLLSGVGIIILMYFLGKELFNEKIGILSAILAAISPWDIYLSRGGFEAHFALFLALLGILAFIKEKYVFWAIPWGIAIFTYPTFKFTLPILFIVLAFIKNVPKLVNKKKFWVGILILAFFGAEAIFQTFKAGSEERFLSENIFSDKLLHTNIVQTIDYERTVSTIPNFLKPILINKEIEYGRKLLDNYMENLSPSFLILRGDGNPRHNPGEMGMIYLVELPLIVIALFMLWKENRKNFVILLSIILITPLATMLMGGVHALRNDLMLPSLILLSSYVISKITKKGRIIIFAAIGIQFAYILFRIYTIAPSKFASFWSADAKKEAYLAASKASQGQKVYLNVTKIDNIEYAYEVYARLDPRVVIAESSKFPKVYGNVTITDK